MNYFEFFLDIEGEGEVDSISNIESCGLRAAELSKSGLFGSFVDISCGNRLGRMISETPIEMPEPVDKFLCCTLYSAVLTKNGNIFWRLKKTSSTAYCDCWEKCECKALVTGNNAKREQLLSGMLQCPALIDGLNSKGNTFYSFWLALLLIEQEGYTKHSKRPGPTTTTTAYGVPIPEHDLEPPKFARKTLDLAIGNWDVVKGLLDVGIKKPNALINSRIEDDQPILENVFHLLEHNGSTHLDKFVLTLLGWCEESSLDTS
ncbi:unnamed protein product [Meloidogyne enterolobii]|uniref:Uncharacterized protein n=1 Tax=Meloidogyne enterolobii TaxID=390850 RepID=A0ACB1B5N3_MELEN